MPVYQPVTDPTELVFWDVKPSDSAHMDDFLEEPVVAMLGGLFLFRELTIRW
jgi:hypothetical protein